MEASWARVDEGNWQVGAKFQQVLMCLYPDCYIIWELLCWGTVSEDSSTNFLMVVSNVNLKDQGHCEHLKWCLIWRAWWKFLLLVPCLTGNVGKKHSSRVYIVDDCPDLCRFSPSILMKLAISKWENPPWPFTSPIITNEQSHHLPKMLFMKMSCNFFFWWCWKCINIEY